MHCEYICMKRISGQLPPGVITLHLRPMVGNTSPIRATLRPLGSSLANRIQKSYGFCRKNTYFFRKFSNFKRKD